MTDQMVREADRFFDGGSLDGSEPPRPTGAMRVRLDRVVESKTRKLLFWEWTTPATEQFKMERRIGYRDRHHTEPFIVPNHLNYQRYRTDLTSVPNLFTWLVPRTGLHLPAALLHDGLVYNLPSEPQSYEGPDDLTRVEADRIFRDAMFDLGTGLPRRWLMWTAVTLATVWAGIGTRAKTWYYRFAVFGSILLIVTLGILATLDLADVWNVLPWMGEHSTGRELLLGAIAAVVIPAILSILWIPLWRAGLIAGIALALLLHVTVALLVLTGLFQLIDVVTREPPEE